MGWVKADLLPTENTTLEILRLRQKIEELQIRLAESEQYSGAGTEHLAQGDDKIELSYRFSVRNPNSYKDRVHYVGQFEITWNRLFASVSPLLIDEASDTSFKRALDELVMQETLEARKRISAKAEKEGRIVESFTLEENDFNTIKVQLIGLKLIAKSTKRKVRGVSDKAAYWSLTSYGETVMINLRAIPKPTV